MVSGPSHRAPAWSHDGTRLLYLGVLESHSAIRLINADGSGITTVLRTGDYIPELAWWP